MEINEFHNSNTNAQIERSSQNTISILVVDDDVVCLAVIAAVLKRWNYQVMTVKHSPDALCILRAKTLKFDLIIADVHMPDMDGFELQQQIHEEFQLPVVLMSADDKASTVWRGCQSGAVFFLVKPITTEDVKDLWVYGEQWKKNLAKKNSLLINRAFSDGNEYDVSNKLNIRYSNRELQNNDNGRSKGKKAQISGTNRSNVVWTPTLHSKFLRALHCLGPERSVARNIVDFMNVPGLTREQVSSHLQKYRNFQKKMVDATTKVQCGKYDANMLDRHKLQKLRSSSFLSHEALLGNGQTNGVTYPVSSTDQMQLHQPETLNFSSSDQISNGFNPVQASVPNHSSSHSFPMELQPQNCFINNASGSSNNPTLPMYGNVFPQQSDGIVDPSNVFLNGYILQSTDQNQVQEKNVGDSPMVYKPISITEKQKHGEKIGSNSSTSTSTSFTVDELEAMLSENPYEGEAGGCLNSADDFGSFSFNNLEPSGNQPFNGDHQVTNDDSLASFVLPGQFHNQDNVGVDNHS